MQSYLEIINNILNHGMEKFPERKEGNKGDVDGTVKTIGLPNVNWEHDMKNGFPLLTTKKMGLKNIATELEFFVKGLTDKRWLNDRKCYIWNAFANPEHVNQLAGVQDNNKKSYQAAEHDLGPIYGYQWRKFNKTYMSGTIGNQSEDDGDWTNYIDQLKNVVDSLHNNPQDRRMVCSAWNPNQMQFMALPPCHVLWNVTVYGGRLHLSWHQRSCDLFLGVPYNIASYALLLLLLSKEANLEPGTLAARFMDCHLYSNQFEVAKEQLKRQPHTLCKVELPNTLKSDKPFSIFDWTYEDIELVSYKYHPKLTCEVVV